MILILLVILALMLVGMNGFLVKMVLEKKDEKTASYESIGTVSSTWPTGPRVPNRAANSGDASETERLLDFEGEDSRESDNPAFGGEEYHEPGTTVLDSDTVTNVVFPFSTGNQHVLHNYFSSSFRNTDTRRKKIGNIQLAYSEPLCKEREWHSNIFLEYVNSSNWNHPLKAHEQQNRATSNAERSTSANSNFSAMRNVNRTSSDVILGRTGYNIQDHPVYELCYENLLRPVAE